MNKVMCPLYDEYIMDSDCFEISMVAEHLAPKRLLDNIVTANENFEKICLGCKNHRE